MTSTSSANATPRILLVGPHLDHYPFPPDVVARLPTFRQHVRQAMDESRAAGIQITELGLLKGAEVAGLTSELRLQLWDGVVLASGLRSAPPFTPLLEQLVDCIRINAPQARIMFNATGPLDTLDAIKRWFPAIYYTAPTAQPTATVQ